MLLLKNKQTCCRIFASCPYIPARKDRLFVLVASKRRIDISRKETIIPFTETSICIIYVKNDTIQKSLHLKIISKSKRLLKKERKTKNIQTPSVSIKKSLALKGLKMTFRVKKRRTRIKANASLKITKLSRTNTAKDKQSISTAKENQKEKGVKTHNHCTYVKMAF